MTRSRPFSLVLLLWLLCPPSGRAKDALPIDITVIGAPVLSPGAPADLRIFARAVDGMTNLRPPTDGRMTLILRNQAGQEATLYDGPMASPGLQELHFTVPPWPTGQARLDVRFRADSSNRRVTVPIELRRRARLWLQRGPGPREDGTIDARAVLLNDDLRPLGRMPLQFAIENGDGRPLVELEAITDPDGIASATLALPAGARWIAAKAPGLDEVYDRLPLEPPARSKAAPGLSIWAEGGRLFAGLPNNIFVLSDAGRPSAVELEGAGTSTIDELGLARLTLPASFRLPASLRFTIRAEGGAGEVQERSFPHAPPGALRLSIDQVFFPPEATLRVLVETTAEDGPCHLDVLERGQTVQTTSALLRGGRALFDVSLVKEAAGTLILHAYRLGATGAVVEDARQIYVQPRALLEITVQRRQSTFAASEEARLWLRVSDQKGAPRRAVLGVFASATAGFPGPLAPDLDILAAPRLWRACLPIGLWTRALTHPRTLGAARQRLAAAILAGDPPANLKRVLWSSATERLQRAEGDHAAIRKALELEPALTPRPLGIRTKSGWSYPDDLLSRLIENGTLAERHHLDPLGQPYTPAAIELLWPDLAPERVLGKREFARLGALREALVDLIRLQGEVPRNPAALRTALNEAWSTLDRRSPGLLRDSAFEPYSLNELKASPGFADEDIQDQLQAPRIRRIRAALSRYADLSRRWFRLPAGPLSEDLVLRLIRRGLLVPADGRDLWGNLYRLEPGPVDGAVIASAGPDGEPGSPDDRRFAPATDPGFARLARNLLGEDLEGQVERARPPGACPAGRADVAEPLAFLPSLKTDQEGAVELRIPLPRRAGPVRLTITAHTEDGEVGAATHTIDVR